MFVLITGFTEIERPVQASRARFWAIIQSSEPLRWRTAKDVVGDRTEIRAVTGLLEVIYPASVIFPGDRRNGQPLADLLVEEWHADGGSSDGF